jgi:hypothetical protein
MRVATAGGRGVARGETLTFAHLSEVAFWPVAFANTNFNGLVQAIPEENNTFLFLESTAQGVTGKFYEMYQGAVRRDHLWNGYEVFFSAWFESDEYRETAPADFVRTPEEEKMLVQFAPLLNSNDQLYWRRKKVATSGIELFKQEYPATAEEAFLSTGRPIFNTESLNERLQIAKVKKAIRQMTLEVRYDEKTGKPLPLRVLAENARGELLIYRERDEAESYTIGADVGMGIRGGVKGRREGDSSVAQVLDSKRRQVAVWRGIIHPDQFSNVLVTLGYHYNCATIAAERNNHGLVTCIGLRDANYPYIYTDHAEGTLEPDKDTINLGFLTSERTKPLIIDKLRELDREGGIEINDPTTLSEMMTFVVTENGKMEAEGGTHDDCVMALAIAAYVSDDAWTPVATSDEDYIEAI